MIGRRNWSRGGSLAVLGALYSVALAIGAVVALAAADLGAWRGALAGDLAAAAVVFLGSVASDNTSTYDPFWSVMPVALASWWWAMAADPGADRARLLIIALLLGVWGVRLTGNFIGGWRGLNHEDWRYTEYRRLGTVRYWMVSAIGLQLMPTLVVIAAMLPVYAATVWESHPFGVIDVLAAGLVVTGIAIEALADEQKRRFGRAAAPGSILRSGLWGRVRHPNYLGEILVWWGVWGFAVASRLDRAWTIVGPLAITALFATVSVPLMDRRMRARHPGYREVEKTLPALVPFRRASAPADWANRR